MRTVKIWEEKVKQMVVKRKFPPRLQKDILSLTPPIITNIYKSRYIFGDTNTGKTVYSAFILLEIEKRMYLKNKPGTTLFIGTAELFASIKKAYDKDSEYTESQIINKYQSVDCLVLDDFGTVKPTEWVYQCLYLIINYRYEHMLTTIITSNITLEEISDTFNDDRIPSRIERDGIIVKKNSYAH